MNEEENTSKSPEGTANPDGSRPETSLPDMEDTRLDRLETILLKRMAAIASSIAELKTGGGTAPEMANLTDQYRNLSARLSLLEENFARICNVVGRLDQELQALIGNANGGDR